jgi:hypothetical protein
VDERTWVGTGDGRRPAGNLIRVASSTEPPPSCPVPCCSPESTGESSYSSRVIAPSTGRAIWRMTTGQEPPPIGDIRHVARRSPRRRLRVRPMSCDTTQAGCRGSRKVRQLMVQRAVIYDDCKVCQGRGAVTCGVCSGIGHIRESQHEESGVRLQLGGTGGQAHRRTTATMHRDCTDCGGTGAVSCTACHGHGMKGLPSFAGKLY